MKLLLPLAFMLICFQGYSQYPVSDTSSSKSRIRVGHSGFVYLDKVWWVPVMKGDTITNEVDSIIIEGDTMTAIRNLLLFCMDEKEEKDAANMVLYRLNLDKLAVFLKQKDFTSAVKYYKKTVAAIEKKRDIQFKK